MRLARTTLVTVLLAACGAGTQLQTDYDRRVNFARYRTFEVVPGKVVDNGIVDVRDTLVRDRVEGALDDTLRRKGLIATNEDPDLLIMYTAGARTKQELVHTWRPDPYLWGPGMDDVWLAEYEEGTLVVDVIDASTKKLVFRSIAKADDENFRSESFIRDAVEKSLEGYPPKRKR